MASSALNIFAFLCSTFLYYFKIKPVLNVSIVGNPTEMNNYNSSYYKSLGLYFLLVIALQLLSNISLIQSTCGGSFSENIGAAGIYTFVPWTLIFGMVMIVLVMFPGFKSAFSDVIGYYFVYSTANKVLTELLIDKDVNQSIRATGTNDDVKNKLQDASDIIVKICGNMSILINQIVPENFAEYWKLIDPLMKTKYQNDAPTSSDLKNKLFNLVVARDNIGEALWFIYTGILLSSIVQMKLSTRGCSSNSATMQKNYQEFLDKEKKSKEQEELATSTTYTMG